MFRPLMTAGAMLAIILVVFGFAAIRGPDGNPWFLAFGILLAVVVFAIAALHTFATMGS